LLVGEEVAMADEPPAKTFIGGRHGSPSVTVAFPFSRVQHVDAELRALVEELTGLVERLATADDAERAAIAAAARDLRMRLGDGE
jgi:hypothetical protein